MPASRSSGTSRSSKAPGRASDLLLAFCVLATIGAAAALWFHSNGYLLWYGDAEAHLNVARRMVDTRTPGWRQIGTAWLPLPHWLMLPFVRYDSLWRNGLAGTIPSAACFVIAGTFLFAAARRLFASAAAGATAALVFALNPNALYLQSTAMTEPLFFCALLAMLYFLIVYRDTASPVALGAGATALLAATLTRYEAWFLIPFAAAVVAALARKRRVAAAAAFAAIATLGPLYWLGHNFWHFGDALEFYRGEYSARAIQGAATYPGRGDWTQAALQYFAAMRWTIGWPAIGLAAAGIAACAIRRFVWPLALLAVAPLFYVLSVYSGATPIYVPDLDPHSWYNARYGLAALPLVALASAGLVPLAPRWRATAAGLVVAIAISIWVAYPRAENWICWKESRVNSEDRRVWTQEAAQYLREHYRGGGIFSMLGDPAAIFREAGIPLHETLNECDEPYWHGAVARPDLMLREEWVVAPVGSPVAAAMKKAPRYGLLKRISVGGRPVIEIRRRGYGAAPAKMELSP
jgi:hypothetical protein